MYRKVGLARFIGHLDTVRVLQRAVRRAGIRSVYSQGFSPRLKLSFSSPLPVGFTSDCEFFDVSLADPATNGKPRPDSIRRDLQSHLPEGFYVKEVQILEDRPPALSETFRAAEYEIELPRDCRVNHDRMLKRSEDEELTLPDAGRPGHQETTPLDCVLRTSWREGESGSSVVSIVLSQDIPGKGGLRRTICRILGIELESLEKCRVHKKRVYGKGEQV